MTETAPDATAITTPWPSGFPAHKPGFTVSAVREVQADADAVFAWVRRIDLHPPHYPALRLVRHRRGAWPVLEEGSTFAILLGGMFNPAVTVTKVDVPGRSLAWGQNAAPLSVCHAFTVKPIGGGRTLILCEERAVGPLAKVLRPLFRRGLQKTQHEWTDALVRMVAAHPDGPPRS